MRKQIFKKKEGFTLIETLLAIFILVVGVVSVVMMISLGLQIETKAKMKSCASKLAQEKMEEVISESYEQATSSSEDYGVISNLNYFKREVDVSYYDIQSSVISDTDLGAKIIKISVFWKNPPTFSEKSVVMESLKVKK